MQWMVVVKTGQSPNRSIVAIGIANAHLKNERTIFGTTQYSRILAHSKRGRSNVSHQSEDEYNQKNQA
jgi:hypothetical protein